MFKMLSVMRLALSTQTGLTIRAKLMDSCKVNKRRITIWGTLTVAILTCCWLQPAARAQKQPASAESPSVAWRLPAGASAEDYVGAATCGACHRDEAGQYAKTVHASAAPAGVTVGTGCESCHGPGRAHVMAIGQSGGDATKVAAAKKLIYGFHGKAADNAARCLTCHESSKGQDLFNRSEHKLQGISCEQCHSAHLLQQTQKRERDEPQSPQAQFFSRPTLTEETRWLNQSLLKKSQPELCFGCHATIQAQFALPAHHRVPEGLMKCTDCHNAHGTANRPLLKQTSFEVCVSCHVEKRGPFVYEHAAVKVEGCVACHSPHGSVTRNNLLRREGRFLCLQCHVDPFAANVPHGRFGFQTRGECVRCHTTPHGSNVNEFLLE
jgi:predicted CXXCH cytochrome family protein